MSNDFNMILIAQYQPHNVSIPTEGSNFEDDAESRTSDSKDIGFFDVGVTTMDFALRHFDEDSYQNLGMCSLDALFVAFTTASSHAKLPSWEAPTSQDDEDITSKHLNPFNPTHRYLTDPEDPESDVDPQLFYDSGHNMQIYNSVSDISSNDNLSPWNGLASYRNPEVRNVRSVSLKTPLILTGWGYDTTGGPVPGSDGEFSDGAFSNPAIWKSGPLDVRWDDQRKVWAANGSNTCRLVLKIDLITAGNAPDAGSATIAINYDGTPYNLVIGWEDDIDTIEETIETLLGLSAGDMANRVTGSPIATWSVNIRFPDMDLLSSAGNTTHDFTFEGEDIEGNVHVQICCLDV